MQSLILAAMSVNDVPYVSLGKNLKAAIGSAKLLKPTKKYQIEINDAETLSTSTSAAAKCMELMTAMSLRESSGKPNKSISK